MPVALAAQRSRPDLILVWCDRQGLPRGVRGESIVFPRCYVADARTDEALRAIETGRFAHVSTEADATLGSILKREGISYTETTLEPGASAVALLERARNSIVVFSSAAPMGSPAENSIHAPLAIWYPRLLKPRAADDLLVSQVDLMPTLLALSGIAVPAEVQGRNLAPLLRGEAAEPPDSVYVEGNTWRVLIRGYQKLVTDLAGTPEHLYNLAADPAEQNDLVRDPSSRLNRDGLAALAQVWMRRVGDGLDPSGLKRR